MLSSSIIHASKNCKAAPERDRPPKVNTSSETNTPSSAPSPGILRSMLSYAFSYILPKQTNLLQEPPLLEVRSELAEVTNKQTEEEEKEEDFIDAPSLNIRKFSLATYLTTGWLRETTDMQLYSSVYVKMLQISLLHAMH